MKRQLLSVLTLAVFTVLALGSGQAKPKGVPGIPGSGSVVFMHGQMNIREGPGTKHKIVGSAEPGQMLRLDDLDPDGWAAVYGRRGERGYIYARSDRIRRVPAPPEWDALSPKETDLMDRLLLACREDAVELRLLTQRSLRGAPAAGLHPTRAEFLGRLAASVSDVGSDADCSAAADFVLLTLR